MQNYMFEWVKMHQFSKCHLGVRGNILDFPRPAVTPLFLLRIFILWLLEEKYNILLMLDVIVSSKSFFINSKNCIWVLVFDFNWTQGIVSFHNKHWLDFVMETVTKGWLMPGISIWQCYRSQTLLLYKQASRQGKKSSSSLCKIDFQNDVGNLEYEFSHSLFCFNSFSYVMVCHSYVTNLKQNHKYVRMYMYKCGDILFVC